MVGRPDLAHCVCALAVQGLVGFVEGTLDVLRMRHGLTLLLQFLLLALLQVGVSQFAVLELQEVQVLAVALDVVLQLLQLALGSQQLREGLLIVCQLLLVAGDDVNHAQLEVLLVQQQVLVLRVYVDQTFAQLLEHGERHGGVVDKGTALARCGQLTTDDGILGLVLNVVVIKEGFHVIAAQVEVGLDDTLVCPLLDGLRVSALTQQQSYGAQNDALARSGLACYHGESGVQLNVEHINQRKVLDV